MSDFAKRVLEIAATEGEAAAEAFAMKAVEHVEINEDGEMIDNRTGEPIPGGDDQFEPC